jgi:ABC-type lipoprotein export system ATPase subunit
MEEGLLVSLKDIEKNYTLGKNCVHVLSDVNLDVAKGDFISIMGTSGSGKTTLLHIVGTLLQPDSGTYQLNGREIGSLSDRERSWIRAHWIGYVFQTFDLISEQDVWQNVAMPYLYRGETKSAVDRQVDAAIDVVGLSERKHHRPAELSGGEMQRVAIARALSIAPKLILADEPTGNLDEENSKEILNLLRRLNESGATIILVTHDQNVAGMTNRILTMKNGRLAS